VNWDGGRALPGFTLTLHFQAMGAWAVLSLF
jgi:hypothetical protein